MSRYFHIATMGCQMNVYDSDHLAQVLVKADFLPTQDPGQADLVLINTCTVRAKAEQKAYSLLGRILSIKKRRPGLIVGLTGCIAQQEGARLMERFPGLDLVLGTREVGRADEILGRLISERERIVATDMDLDPPRRVESNGYFKGRVKAFLSIMEGCNNFCTYCIVPYVRGREVSRPPEEIMAEAGDLIQNGVREITLLGQNVNSYSWEEKKGYGFSALLREVSQLPGLARIRFTTSHPKDLSDDLIACFAELPNLCPHIHLPFQAGSNRVLRRMNRGYTREQYMERVWKLRAVRTEIAISSDVMVGFPQESHEDFEMTLDLIQKIRFDSLYSFKYSDRKGTLAAKMGDKIPEAEKTRRLSTLQRIQEEITLEKNRRLEGRLQEVLVEGEGKRPGQWTGRTGCNRVVNFNNNTNILGKLAKVRIKHGFANSLWGDLVGMAGA